MIGVNFSKVRAAYFLNCLASGTPIEPEGGWTIDDMTMLAGACHFALLSHGPWQQRVARIVGENVPAELDSEHREAVEETHFADLRAAIEFCADLTMRIQDGVYDAAYEPEVAALLRGDTRQLRPIHGFRSYGDDQ